MTKVAVIIPVSDFDKALNYYSSVMGFECVEEDFLLPNGAVDTILRLKNVRREARIHSPPGKGFPIFGYRIERNFLSYIEVLRSRGALVEEVLETPGGYYARVADPDENQFEVECASFDEADGSFDKSS